MRFRVPAIFPWCQCHLCHISLVPSFFVVSARCRAATITLVSPVRCSSAELEEKKSEQLRVLHLSLPGVRGPLPVSEQLSSFWSSPRRQLRWRVPERICHLSIPVWHDDILEISLPAHWHTILLAWILGSLSLSWDVKLFISKQWLSSWRWKAVKQKYNLLEAGAGTAPSDAARIKSQNNIRI